MKSILAFFIVLVSVVYAVPKTPRDVKDAGQPTPLADFITQAQTNINNLAEQFQKQLNLPDQESVVNTIKDQSTTFVTNLQTYIAKASEEVKTKSPEIEKLWEDAKVRFTKVADDINAQIPNAKEQAGALGAKMQEGIQVLLQESEKASKTFNENSGKVQEDIAKLTKQAVDLAVQTAQNLNNKLKTAAETPKN